MGVVVSSMFLTQRPLYKRRFHDPVETNCFIHEPFQFYTFKELEKKASDMAFFPKHISFLLALLLFLHISVKYEAYKEVHLTIMNDLEAGQDVDIQRWSYDNTLHEKTVAKGGVYAFNFSPDIFGRTKFDCSVKMPSPPANETHYFVPYKQDRDRKKCAICNWKITRKQACMINYANNGAYDICYGWEP